VFLRQAQDKLTLRRTVQVRLGINTLRLPGTRRKSLRCAWHAHLRGLAKAIHEISGLVRLNNCDQITMKSIGINIAAVLSHAASFLFAGIPALKAQYLWQQCLVMFYRKN
jgi:hypothetical protein